MPDSLTRIRANLKGWCQDASLLEKVGAVLLAPSALPFFIQAAMDNDIRRNTLTGKIYVPERSIR